MILEGFEIENWSCIKHVAVDGLPPTGLIVLHGPNGTGKSSIVEALRACLMDKKSTSKAIDRAFPKNSNEKPRVSVCFRSGGTSWRITKQFGTRESRLESRTPVGHWKLETTDPSGAHERVQQLVGNTNSSLGLQQLLWLTQAEFHLPDPKTFDTDVQSRLRSILGVLQTPLDDQFLGRVKKEWSQWYAARSKPGAQPALKKGCPLDKDLELLKQYKVELERIEQEYQEFQGMLERSTALEASAANLRRQVCEETRLCNELQEEYQKSQARREAFQRAGEDAERAEQAVSGARAKKQKRADDEQRIRDTEMAASEARRDVEETCGRLRVAEDKLRELRQKRQGLGDSGRALQARLNNVAEQRQLLALEEQIKTARDRLANGLEAHNRLEELKQQARDRPCPDPAAVEQLELNRHDANRRRADLEAAAIRLTLYPEPGVRFPHLVIDGIPTRAVDTPADCQPTWHSIRRCAEVTIPGWGRAELVRGSDVRTLDQIEKDLNELDRSFAEELAPFGIASGDPSALDQLRRLVAEREVREPELVRRCGELNRLAPNGLDELRREVAELENRRLAWYAEPASSPLPGPLYPNPGSLDDLACELTTEIEAHQITAAALELEMQELESLIEGPSEPVRGVGKQADEGNKRHAAAAGLRRQERAAQNRLTVVIARLEAFRDDLDQSPSVVDLERDLGHSERALAQAQAALEASRLSESEQTIGDRRDAAADARKAVQNQLLSVEKELYELKGALSQSEGLHQTRAAACARVEVLERKTERECLQRDAYDELYALFEECRQKQLGTVMGPIHDRIARWMRLLQIGGYEQIRFNDQFLPETLIAKGGAIELPLAEESVGSIEQIALMVRLALGSVLSTPEDPVVAILDDPLTHGDVMRLGLMRAVLKNAAAGDFASTPPAGPLQIVVFTCHPERFTIDGAKTIDLSSPAVLTRSS
jgi:hypothetical protein